jgi:small subunit ribosomal protein S8
MSMQDPIADMLTRLRNATMALQPEVAMPTSKMKRAIAEVLQGEGYITGYREDGEGIARRLVIQLKYRRRVPVIEGIRRVSRTSCRMYCHCREIPRVRNGMGIVIISTPKGVLSGRQARQENVGGEILCTVW